MVKMKRTLFSVVFLLLCIQVLCTAGSSFNLKFPLNDNDTTGLTIYIKRVFGNLTDPTDLSSARENIEIAETICRERGIPIPPLLHLAKAEYSLITKDYSTSSGEATAALEKSRNTNDRKNEARALTFLGKYYLKTGFFRESLSYFESSNDFASKENLTGIKPSNYLGISDIHLSLKNHQEYRDVLELAADAAINENDTSKLMAAYFRLGTSYTENERNFGKADSLLKLCLQTSVLKGDSVFSGLALANIGWNLYLEHQYDSAIAAYNRSLDYSLPVKSFSTSANSYGNLGTIYRDLKKTRLALDFYDRAIEQAKLADDNYALSWVYKDMSDLYLNKGDTSNAYKNYVLFKQFNDIYMSRTNVQGMDEANARFEADTRRKEVELLSLRLRNQRLVIYGSTGFLLLLLSMVVLIYSRARIEAKRKISEMDRKIAEVTQANLRQQMNPHFIFNTLNSIQYYMYQHDKLATNDYLTKFSSLIRKVLENSQHTTIPIRDEIDALRLYLDLESVRFKGKFEYRINIDEEIDTILYKIPAMLIQPYVENSICHGITPSENKGLLNIEIKLVNNHISCVIEDNGIGRKAANELKNKADKAHNSLGTQITSSRLDLVNALYGTSLKTIYTDLVNVNGEPAGTRVEINLPILT